MVKIGYKVLLAADVWTYGTRELTDINGTPRTSLVGANEPIYTRLDEKLSGKETFEDAIPAAPLSGTYGKKFKDLVNPMRVLVPLYVYGHERAVYSYVDPGTIYTDTIFIYSHDFDNYPLEKLGFVARVWGTETGTKGIKLYNETDASDVVEVTWSGTGTDPKAGLGDVSALTGKKRFGIYKKASTSTEDIKFSDVYIILQRKSA